MNEAGKPSGPTETAVVELRGVQLKFDDDVEVLRDVSLSVGPRERLVILGQSGSGKSTLLRSIVGVQRLSGGAVSVLGEPAGSPISRVRVGYVTQSPSVYGNLTVVENLQFFASVLGVAAVVVRKVRSANEERALWHEATTAPDLR